MSESPIDYAPPDPSAHRRRLIKQLLIIGVCLLVLTLGVCAVGMNRALVNVGRIHTSSNLRQIGQAVMLYVQDNGGVYPPDFQAVIRTQQVSTWAFVCQNSDDKPAEGLTLEQRLHDFAQPGRCSFIYVGSGLKEPVARGAILAFDSPAHEHEHTSVLWADGSVDEVSFPMLMQIIEDLSAGKSPPSSSTNLTLRQARQIYDRKWRSRIPAMQTSGWQIPTTQPAE